MKSKFIGGTDGDNRCINMYPEVTVAGKKEPGRMITCPGFAEWLDPGVFGEVRGGKAASDGNLYAIVKDTVFKIDTNKNTTTLGTIDTTSGPVDPVDNGFQLAFADGDKGYCYTYATGVFGQITDLDFPNGTEKIVYTNNFGLAIAPETERLYISGITALHGDFLIWDALDFTSASVSPDRATGIEVDYYVMVAGPDSIEQFYYDGNADFPFAPVQGAPIKQGCIAPNSLKRFDNSIAWLGGGEGGQGIVWRLADAVAQRISNHAIERLIAGWGTPELVRAFTYQQDGHSFYVLFHPTAGHAVVFDAATNEWHERAGFSKGDFTRWGANCHVAFAGLNLVGHYSNGKIYALDKTSYNYDYEYLKILRQWRGPNTEDKRMALRRMTIDCKAGVGLNSGQGSDPQLMVRCSADQGRTWNNERTVSMGRIGQTDKELPVLTRLGTQRDWTWEISSTDPVEREFNGVYFE